MDEHFTLKFLNDFGVNSDRKEVLPSNANESKFSSTICSQNWPFLPKGHKQLAFPSLCLRQIPSTHSTPINSVATGKLK